MDSDRIQTLNYCTHAIEDLLGVESALREGAPASAHALRGVIGLLRRSVKFILPNCCNLLDPEQMRQSHLDLMHLPFPCVAFEAPWEGDHEGPEYLGEFRQSKASKRIALCWEATRDHELVPGLNEILDVFPDGGVFVLPIYWGPAFGQWTMAFGGTFIPFGGTVTRMVLDTTLPATHIAHTAMLESGQSKADALSFRAEPFVLMPEFFDHAVATYGSHEKALAQIIMDSHDETMVLIQACSVLNCANVTTAEMVAPLALNKKRHAKGKEPFFAYKVLQLSPERNAVGKRGTTGEHASPKMHLRRGHLRRLDTKTIWVRPAMVNPGSARGVIQKDYRLTRS